MLRNSLIILLLLTSVSWAQNQKAGSCTVNNFCAASGNCQSYTPGTGNVCTSLVSQGLMSSCTEQSLLPITLANPNVGIGSTAPGQTLDIQGTVRTIGFNMPTGEMNNYVLTSDAHGNGSWQASQGGGGSMTWPSVAGIAVYAGGSAWGSSLAEVDGDIIYGTGGAWTVQAPPTWNQSTTGNAATATNMSTNGTGTQVWGMNSGSQGWINQSGGGGTNYWLLGNNNIGIATFGTGNNVGIGTSTASQLLVVGSTPTIQFNVDSGGDISYYGGLTQHSASSNAFIGTTTFGNTTATIDNAGNIYTTTKGQFGGGIGSADTLHVTGTASISGNVGINGGNTSTAPLNVTGNALISGGIQGQTIGVGTETVSGNSTITGTLGAGTVGMGTFNLSGNGTTTGIFNSGTIGVATLNASGTITTLITASTPVVTNGSSQLVAATNLKDLAYCQSNGTNCPAAGANYWLQGANNVGVSTVVPGGVGIGTINTGNGAMAILGNVGIGTWGAQANLDVEGAGTIKAAGQITANNYNSTGSTIPANGWTESAANQLTFATNSLQNMVINSSGNLGIGTINAATSVKIGTGTTITGTVGNSGNIQENGGSLTSGNLTKSDANQNIVDAGVNFGTLTNGDYCTYASSGTQISCTSSGGSGTNYWGLTNVGIFTGEPSNVQNVRIGTTVSASTFNVLGNIGVGTVGSSNFLLTSAPNGGAQFEGNVGIGTNVPAGRLDVEGTLTNTTFYSNGLTASSGFGNVGIGTIWPHGALQVGNGTNICSSGSNCFGGNMGVGTTSPTSSIEVEGGNVGIGTTQTAPYPLFVNGNVGIGSVFLIGQGTASPTHLCIASGGRAIFTCL